MPVALGLIGLLVGLVSLPPFVYASASKAWTGGPYDAEPDDTVQAVT